jgi:hypothetical protein
MPVFVSGKDFTMKKRSARTPIRCIVLLWGNTGKAFGDQAWNIHLRFCQMLCPYVRTPTSAAAHAQV